MPSSAVVTMKSDPSKASDSELLAQFEQGRDRSAFAEVVRRHGEMVMATARRVLGNREDAEDVFQVTFFVLAEKATSLRTKPALGGWLHKIAYRASLETLDCNRRQKKKVERMKEQVVQSAADAVNKENPLENVASEELTQILDQEVTRLPQKLQAVVVLCELEGLTQKEAAKELGLAASTVAERLINARNLLRERMAKRGVQFSVGAMAACVVASVKPTTAMTTATCAETAAKSAMFAAGQSAAVIGVKASVFQSATRVISAMKTTKLIAICLAALAILTLMGPVAGGLGTQLSTTYAGTLFIEDFQDGDFNTVLETTGDVVSWSVVPNQRGSASGASGDLVLGPNDETVPNLGVSLGLDDLRLENVSVRSQLRVTEAGGAAILSARNVDTGNGDNGYFASIAFAPEAGGSLLAAGTGRCWAAARIIHGNRWKSIGETAL